MKVYKFFKIPDQNDRDTIDLEDKYILYAITNKKKYAERFKEDRNMDKFIFKSYEDVAKEEYAAMCNEDGNRGAVLGMYPLTTIFNNHTRENSVQKKILMTYWEKQMIEEPNTLLDNERFWEQMPCPVIFKSKYRKLFDALQYTLYYKLMTADHLPHMVSMALSSDDDDYSAPSIEFDEVAIFIDQIQDTL